MKIVADYKRLTQQRGSLKPISIILLALVSLGTGLIVSILQNPVIKTMNGNNVSWQSEQWTLVNYFAEWCQPCLREIPELNHFANTSGVRVYGVSFDDLTVEALHKVIERQSIRFEVITPDSVSVLPVPMPIVLPTTYVISPEGEVVATLRGEVNAELLLNRINKAKSELL